MNNKVIIGILIVMSCTNLTVKANYDGQYSKSQAQGYEQFKKEHEARQEREYQRKVLDNQEQILQQQRRLERQLEEQERK